jgi:hypothetical protein
MTPSKIRERLEESGDRIDVEAYVEALTYVRDDGTQRR